MEIGGESFAVTDWETKVEPVPSTGLLRMDGSTRLDLPPLKYYARFRVIQGPLYDPAAIDRWKMYDSVGMAVYQGFPIWWASMFADPNRPIKPSDLSGEGR